MPVIPTQIPQFYPETQATIGVTSTSGSVALGTAGDTLLFYNDGASTCFFTLGITTPTAVAGGTTTTANDGSMWLPPGAVMEFRIPDTLVSSNLLCAAVCAAGLTTTLRISRGSGV